MLSSGPLLAILPVLIYYSTPPAPQPPLPEVFTPRPAYEQSRRADGLPDPRGGDAVLDDLNALSARIAELEAEKPDDDARLAELASQSMALRIRRADLVNELFEMGWTADLGARLPELRRTQIEDIRRARPYFARPLYTYDQTLQHIASMHQSDPESAALAERVKLINALSTMQTSRLHIAASDLERLAEIEEQLPADDSLRGYLLSFGMRMCDDPAAVERWEAWILEKLPADCAAVKEIKARALIGKPMTLTGTTFDGSPIDTSQWKGSVIIVDFWGTWCGPCIAGMPELKQLEAEHGGEGLRVLGVLCDPLVDKAEKFRMDQGYTWPQMVDRTLARADILHPIAKQHGIRAFPTYWLIDRRGVLRATPHRGTLGPEVQRLLAEKE